MNVASRGFGPTANRRPSPRWRRLVPVLCCVLLAGCGGKEDEGSADSSVRLAASYHFPGPRSVDAQLRAEAVRDPARDIPVDVPVPPGRRIVEVVLTWTDRGRDPLPWDALRFTLADVSGRRVPERFRVPPQRIRAGTTVRLRGRVGFVLARGVRPRRLLLGSIIAGAPLRAALTLP